MPTWTTIAKFSTFACLKLGARPDGASFAQRKPCSIRCDTCLLSNLFISFLNYAISFRQATFVCTKTENSIPCEESEKFYELNEAIGKEVEEEESDMEQSTKESDTVEAISNKPPARTSRILKRKKTSRQQ